MIRETRETRVEVEWNPRGKSNTKVATGIGFLDHMLEQWAFHGAFDLRPLYLRNSKAEHRVLLMTGAPCLKT